MAKRLPYRYLINIKQVIDKFNQIHYKVSTSELEKRAKYVLSRLVSRFKNNKLHPDDNGMISISGSDGDKLRKSGFKLTKVQDEPQSTNNIDCSDAWWHDI